MRPGPFRPGNRIGISASAGRTCNLECFNEARAVSPGKYANTEPRGVPGIRRARFNEARAVSPGKYGGSARSRRNISPERGFNEARAVSPGKSGSESRSAVTAVAGLTLQ